MNTVDLSTPSGTVRGVRNGVVKVFKGIPFAEPPIGALRFEAAKPIDPWGGVRDCTQFGPVAPQHRDPLVAVIPGSEWNFYDLGVTQAEDCLNLNVWTPSTGSTDSPRAVLFWIHGGAFVAGSGTGAWTDGTVHAEVEGLVVVSVNYRLGALGALALGPSGTGGNNFLRDQILALRWVQVNIEAFGGDPKRVTIAGESAGAMSVAALLAAPEARGLFAQAIIQSGHGLSTVDPDSAARVTERYLSAIGMSDTGPGSQLRRASLYTIGTAQAALAAQLVAPFRPVVDGSFLPAAIDDVIKNGDSAQVPVLIGMNRDETKLFEAIGWGPGAQPPDLRARITERLGGAAGDVDEIAAAYLQEVDGSEAEACSLLATDLDWRLPIDQMADALSAHMPTYRYELTQHTTALGGRMGAPHALDIPYVFGNLDQPGVSEFVGDDADGEIDRRSVEKQCRQAWGSFVRDGSPQAESMPPWKPFSADQDVMMLGADSQLRADRPADRLAFWADAKTGLGIALGD